MVSKQFFYGMTTNDIGKRAYVLKHSYERCLVGVFDKIYMKDIFGMYPEILYPLSSTNKYFFAFYIMVQYFTKIYITSDDKNKYINDYGSRIFPKQKVRKL